MNCKKLRLYINTIASYSLKQLYYHCKYIVYKPTFKKVETSNSQLHLKLHPFIKKPISATALRVKFLNIEETFADWNDMRHGALWAYNLSYMDYLCQEGMTYGEGAKWLDLFCQDIDMHTIALQPYPTAKRVVNWIKFFSKHQRLEQRWVDCLYSQCLHLVKTLEYRLSGGNHLLEDGITLFIAGMFFENKSFTNKGCAIVGQELNKQILPDGAHYEQSPMYHCIVLEGLLDCLNMVSCHMVFANMWHEPIEHIKQYAIRMLGHLQAIIYADSSIPLLNDAARGICAAARDLFDYAYHLELDWVLQPLHECGYRKMENSHMQALVDVGNMTAGYMAGHSHADTFNYELRVDGCPFIIDTGVSTYNKDTRRQYERSTKAHNTVVVDGRDSSEVWGGFRVARRCKVQVLQDSANEVVAKHSGTFKGGWHKRHFYMSDTSFAIDDEIAVGHDGKSMIHLAPGVKVVAYSAECIRTSVCKIYLEGAISVKVFDTEVATEYNKLLKNKSIAMSFSGKMKMIIKQI